MIQKFFVTSCMGQLVWSISQTSHSQQLSLSKMTLKNGFVYHITYPSHAISLNPPLEDTTDILLTFRAYYLTIKVNNKKIINI